MCLEKADRVLLADELCCGAGKAGDKRTCAVPLTVRARPSPGPDVQRPRARRKPRTGNQVPIKGASSDLSAGTPRTVGFG